MYSYYYENIGPEPSITIDGSGQLLWYKFILLMLRRVKVIVTVRVNVRIKTAIIQVEKQILLVVVRAVLARSLHNGDHFKTNS